MPSMFETAYFTDIGDREEQQDRVAVFTRDDARINRFGAETDSSPRTTCE